MKSILFYLFSLFVSLSAVNLEQSCMQTPFWKLNLCEIDCQKCGTNGLCEICPDSFNLIKTKCDQNNDEIYRYTYFTDAELTDSQIKQYNFKLSNQYLSQNSIVTLCKPGAYKFDMIGLFKQQDRLTFNLNFDTPVTSLIFKFNFFTIYQNTKLELIMNGDQIYQTKLAGSNINSTYEPYNDTQQYNYLNVPALTETSSASLIKKINTGSVAFDYDQSKNNVFLQMEVSLMTDPKNSNSFWGFSDFSVVAKKCQNCLPQRLKTLSSNVGIAIAVNAGALLLLILILYACVKFEESKRRKTLESGSSQKHFNKDFNKQEQKEEQKQQKLNLRQTVQRPKDLSPQGKKTKNI